KKFGQNFLMDGGAAQRIARLALDGAPTGARIVEIGAGTGALTQALLEAGADVTAIEIDPQLIAILGNRPQLRAAHIVQADAMEYDYASYAKGKPWLATGNLPYNVATPLMLDFIEMEGGPSTLTVMIQKDVANRLAAKPSTPAYGSLSIAVQYAMIVERAFTLGPRAFYPQPKVDSTVVRLIRRSEPAVQTRDVTLFRKVVRGAFAYRRKTLANSLHLALALERSVVTDALATSGLPAEIRGEQLDLDAFARLADALAAG
ncbi:MAG TPA: 16S rRNA (adenine(1518)-N(6)/adenine(1519)-N(6))-dimethyltransferase RsmA, partial [Candidatus Baltobacteraceae bacterium]|nr:16S rRNA (adenine(1518)-N(6)/adenine(1519)-N(6))-dimethyltransferase RsmA [Candidatus Baltobacteraceae bacterium]